ncbi:MAG: SapC family protein [Rhodocyclaceae bacterium]
MSFPLFYRRPVVLNALRHADIWIEEDGHQFSFARQTNAVRINMQEFVSASAEYPVVFVRGDKSWFPVAILGLRDHTNDFVSADGRWLGDYTPAYVRRYPFAFATTSDGQTRLCVDSNHPGINRAGRGQPLFVHGAPSPYLQEVTEFIQQYEADRIATEAFVGRLAHLDLLQPMHVDAFTKEGPPTRLGPFYIVDRPFMNSLSSSRLADLVRNGEMDTIVAHLHSQRGFRRLIDRQGRH